jgi:hypothetical protein
LYVQQGGYFLLLVLEALSPEQPNQQLDQDQQANFVIARHSTAHWPAIRFITRPICSGHSCSELYLA